MNKSIIGIFFLLLISCDDILEEDIRLYAVSIIAPLHGSLLHANEISFLWESPNNAVQYRFQLVSPDFENAKLGICDSSIVQNKIRLNLLPGTYEWRVRPENIAYRGTWTYACFRIDSTADSGKRIFVK